ncbi:unnamed protein product [Arctogadus glacialis]
MPSSPPEDVWLAGHLLRPDGGCATSAARRERHRRRRVRQGHFKEPSLRRRDSELPVSCGHPGHANFSAGRAPVMPPMTFGLGASEGAGEGRGAARWERGGQWQHRWWETIERMGGWGNGEVVCPGVGDKQSVPRRRLNCSRTVSHGGPCSEGMSAPVFRAVYNEGAEDPR